jgi:N-succinyldiaminopimelate aminotransferase
MVSMFNPRLTETLTDFPFARLNALIAPITPPAHLSMINLAVGEPQGAMPAFARQIVAEEIDGWNKYPPNQGIPDLNLAITEWLSRRYRLPKGLLDPAQHVIPTAGSKEGVYIIATVATPQQKAGGKPIVALPNPFYQAYLGGAVLSGAEPLLVNANAETGFLPDFLSIDDATWDRMAVVYLCSPANPQGAIASLDYLQKLIAKCRQHDAVLAVDECYAEIYDALPPPGALEACQALGQGFDNVVAFHSLSKRSSSAGLRSGFMAGDPRLVGLFKRLRDFGGCQVPLPIQHAATALWRDETHVIENRALYRRKFDLAEAALSGRYGFYRPAGGFFLWLDVGDGEQAALRLWRDAAIRVLPGGYTARAANAGVNPGSEYIRLAIVHDEVTLDAAFARIRRVL